MAAARWLDPNYPLGVPSGIRYQPTLFRGPEVSFDPSFSSVERVYLDASAWIDVARRWVTGADRLFEQLVSQKEWAQRDRWMYERRVLEPRMTARWTLESEHPLEPTILETMRLSLSSRYSVVFDSASFNLYRDGRDSVAWHRDKIREEISDPVVPLVSLGEPRKLLFRPRGGGASRAFSIGHGDLLVTGGSTQRTWEHAILKVARAGSRISIAFRYGVERQEYDSRRS